LNFIPFSLAISFYIIAISKFYLFINTRAPGNALTLQLKEVKLLGDELREVEFVHCNRNSKWLLMNEQIKLVGRCHRPYEVEMLQTVLLACWRQIVTLLCINKAQSSLAKRIHALNMPEH